MPLSVSEPLAVADSLAAFTGEPYDRSAISRAYYAAFHHAKQWHDALPQPGHDIGPRGGEHQTLINQLKNPDATLGPISARDSRIFGAKLQVMRERRVKCDYFLTAVVPRVDCDTQLLQAKDAVSKY